MPQQGPLQWLDGEGWLVLLGGGDWRLGETDQVDARLLSVANLDRPMVVLLSEGSRSEAEDLLEHYALLGGPVGEAFVLSRMSRAQLSNPKFLTLLAEAGILYLGGDNPLPLVRTLYKTPAMERIVKGFTTLQGLTLIGSGGGAVALGAWMTGGTPDVDTVQGFGFLLNSVVIPHFTRTEDAPALQSVLKQSPGLLGLGIPDGAALAFGPRGQVETWGTGEVTAVLKA